MADPLRTLRFLPWGSLLKISVVTTVIVAVTDFLILLGAKLSYPVRQVLIILFKAPLNLLILLAIAVGIGALAVYLLERLEPQLSINNSTLWALVPCLVLTLIIKSSLPLPSLLGSFDEIQLLGVILGIFWKGRPYWR